MGRISFAIVSLLITLTASNCNLAEAANKPSNKTVDKCAAVDPKDICKPGVIVPLWVPYYNLSIGDRIGRSIIYFVTIAYMFLGISVCADRFMASIEVITSKERTVTVKRPDGEVLTVTVRIWNETVSNLTLMALGSSAPEILLSIIEIAGHEFQAGDLGPNTIVGSAAFNLFMIMAICVYVIPEGEVRRQRHLSVFFVTATWSVFAYLWLYMILAVFSEGVIDIWEGVVTFLFFPLTVLTAFIADRKLLVTKFLSKRYRATAMGIRATEDAEVEMMAVDGVDSMGLKRIQDPAVRAFEEHRREFIELMKELRKKNPDIAPDRLQQEAEVEMINRGPKSRAFYRVQATRKLTGGGNIVRKKIEKEHHKSMEQLAHEEELKKAYTCRVYFDPAHYTVLENVGTFDVVISRDGGPPNLTVMVDYYTEDGTANAGSDYYEVKGTLTFHPWDQHVRVPVEIIDDDVFEEDEHFYVHLTNLRVKTKDGLVLDPGQLGGIPVAQLDMPATATVMILDDDHAGVFSFDKPEYEVVENAGRYQLKVIRHSGARGKVLIPYKAIDGTAVGGRDYEVKESELVFDNDEVEKFIEICVVDDEEYEKTEDFYIVLEEPIWAKKLSDQSKVIERYLRRQQRKAALLAGAEQKSLESSGDEEKESEPKELGEDERIAELGKPRLGDISRVTIKIKESMEFRGIVDKMLKTANSSLVVGTSSWREQFIEALTVSGGDDDDDEGGEEEGEKKEGEEGEGEGEEIGRASSPSWKDYIMHFICVPWKLICAFIPPTDYWGGWACFVVSILGVGLQTALVGDLANHFGCTIGLKDAVTAISFVALGTSVPDTFASKVAAVQDKYADASIGNVTGSNGVNVFLGIGIAWTMAAIYHVAKGHQFLVEKGTLGFSVTVFSVEAFLGISVLLLRRSKWCGGELGGPYPLKIATSLFFVILWMVYILMTALESYCVIKGF